MNKATKLILGISLILTQYSLGQIGQSYDYPKCNSQTDTDLKISKVIHGAHLTTIEFEYIRSESPDIYIYLNPPNTDGSYYIETGGERYKLISVFGIGRENGITLASQNKQINFTALFESIPKSVTQFDLIEGGPEGSWNFYGVQLSSSNQNKYEECDNIVYSPASSKPPFREYLAGVKYAVFPVEAKNAFHKNAFSALKKYLHKMGFHEVLFDSDIDFKHSNNLCDYTYAILEWESSTTRSNAQDISLRFISPCLDYEYKFSTTKSLTADGGIVTNTSNYFYNALIKMQDKAKHSYLSHYTINLPRKQTCWTEANLRNYIQDNGCDNIEGIYESTASSYDESKYKVAVRKINETYHLIYLEGARNTGNWSEGEIKATLSPTATPFFYKSKWIMADKSENSDYYLTFDEGLFYLLSDNNDKQMYIKLYPSATDNITSSTAQASSSGTGFAISSNGFIATNYHVIENASSINVRGINGDFSKTYSAEVVVEDKNNDLSIIKIKDSNFINLGTIPYTLEKNSIDVGNSIFVLGYPLLATMGDEIKLTNGIVSSKSGYQGDITSYQITAPVQPGNSGGPMFDKDGNVVGVIMAKHIGAENASYSIKTSYLVNLIDAIDSPIKLQVSNRIDTKSLSEQVKKIKDFIYIIEIN